MTGTIVILNKRGYGFINSRDLPFTRIFFHWTQLRPGTVRFPDLRKGMQVQFEPVEVEGQGTRAMRVEVIQESNEEKVG